MRKTGKHAKNRAPEATHQGATQPGRPEIWHGLAVLGGTAVPHGTARPCHLARPCHMARPARAMWHARATPAGSGFSAF